MAGRRISIEFLGNSRDLVNSIDDAEHHTGRLSTTLKNVGKMAAIGLAAGAVVAAKGLFDMTKGAIEDQAAQRKLATNLKNATGATDDQVASVEDWITAQGKALGVTDDELRPALSKLATATGDVGEAQDLAALAMDASAATGKSLESTAKALADAEQGRLGGLGKLGIATKDAAGNALSLDEIHKNMAKTFDGAAASSAETVAGKMQRLKVTLSEAGETIGSKLIPIVADLAGWFLDKALPAISQFGGWMRDNLGPIFSQVGDVIKSVMGGMNGDVGGTFESIKGIFSDAVSIITSLWATFGGTLTDYAVKTFENMKTVIGGALQVISGIFQVFSSLLKGDWAGVWEGIQKILSGAWDVIKGLVSQGLNLIGTLFQLGWDAIKGIAGAAWEGIKNLAKAGIDKVVDFVTGLPGRATSALSGLAGNLRTVFSSAMNAGLEKVQGIGGTIVDWISGIPAKLLNKLGDFKDAGKSLIGGFVEGMKGAAGLVSDIAGNVWDSVKSLLNNAIDKINSALEFTVKIPASPDVHINPPNIPHIGALANGTRNWRGGLAVVGEEGPELVNLQRGAQVFPHAQSMGMARALGSSGPTIIVNTLDRTGVAEAVEEAFIRHVRNTGQPMQFPTI